MIIQRINSTSTTSQPSTGKGVIPRINTGTALPKPTVTPTVQPVQITPGQKKIDLNQIGSNVISKIKQNAPLIVKGLSFVTSAITNPVATAKNLVKKNIPTPKIETPKVQKPTINKQTVADSFKKAFSMTPIGTTISTAKRVPDVIQGFFGSMKGDPGTFPEVKPIPAKNASGYVAKNKDQALGSFLYNFGKDLLPFMAGGESTTIEQGGKLALESIKGSTTVAPKIAFVQDVVSKFASKEFNAFLNKLAPIKFTLQDLKDVNGAGGVVPTTEQVIKYQKITELADKLGVKIADLITPAEKMGVKPSTNLYDFIKKSIADVLSGLKSTLTPEEQKLLGSGTANKIEQAIGTGELTSQEVIGKVISGGLEKTPEGRQIIKLATEAQTNGQNIVINKVVKEVAKPSVAEAGLGDVKTVPINKVESGLSEMVSSKISTDTPKINKLMEDYKSGADIPAIPVYEEGGKYIVNKDGFHRLTAQKNLGLTDIKVKIEPKTELSATQKQTLETAQSPQITASRGVADRGVVSEAQKVTQPIVGEGREVGVPRENLPIGEGKVKASRLEARMKGVIGDATQEQIDQLGLSTYNVMNRADQKAKAAQYVVNNQQEALDVLQGIKQPPEGIIPESIYVAMTELAREDLTLATKLASLPATALGQRINFLQELNKDNPVTLLNEIYKIREEAFKKRTGRTVKEAVKSEVERIKKEIKTPDKYDWSSFLDSIECK